MIDGVHDDGTGACTVDVPADPYIIPPIRELRISLDELTDAQITPSCIVDGYLYADVALLAAPGGTGKTTLVMHEATHIALGLPLFGLEIRKPGPVLIVTAEDRREILIARLCRSWRRWTSAPRRAPRSASAC